MFLSIAAAKGSDHAAYDLGPALPTGTQNLPVNKAEAIRLLKKCSDGTCKTKLLSKGRIAKALAKLQELVGDGDDV